MVSFTTHKPDGVVEENLSILLEHVKGSPDVSFMPAGLGI